MAKNTASTPQAALPSVKKSARWKLRIIEKWREGSCDPEVIVSDSVGSIDRRTGVAALHARRPRGALRGRSTR